MERSPGGGSGEVLNVQEQAARTEPTALPAHILVVDDAPEIRELLRASLEDAGYTVGTASNGQEALAAVNRSRYGLQAGVFTASLPNTLSAFDQIETGGVIINDVPTWRIDHMPYGGVKDSGLGREGPRYTIEEMTEPKLLVINTEMG